MALWPLLETLPSALPSALKGLPPEASHCPQPCFQQPLMAPSAQASLASSHSTKCPSAGPQDLCISHTFHQECFSPPYSLGFPEPPVVVHSSFIYLLNNASQIYFFTFSILLFVLCPRPRAEQVLDDNS